MIDFQQYISEGVYDPNIFKAFFLAGGPGSGKSWVSERALSGMGLKVINSDNAFARALEKEKMSLNFATQDAKEIARRDEIRAKAPEIIRSNTGSCKNIFAMAPRNATKKATYKKPPI